MIWDSILVRLKAQGVMGICLDEDLSLRHVDSVGTMLVVPIGVKAIDADCFREQKNLCDVRVAPTVKRIDKGVFRDCENLEYIYLPESLSYLHDNVAYGNSAEVVIIKG